ncbi:MAG: hypothetical protein ACRC0X_04695 [Brevinema sp.]
MQLDQALLQTLDIYIPIAGTVLLISFLLPIRTTHLITIGFLYSILIIGLQFGIKDILLPYTKAKTQISTEKIDNQLVSQEFEYMDTLPYKYGIVIQNADMCFMFGITAQQNSSSYLIKNVFFKTQLKGQQSFSLFSEYAKIISNQIIFYEAKIPQDPQQPKNYLLPLPFDMYSFFHTWNTTDPRHIELVPIILNRSFSQSFILPIILAITQYLIGFVLLLIIGTIATSISSSLSFNKLGILGSVAVLVCSYPLVLLIYNYLLLITQSIIYGLIKI